MDPLHVLRVLQRQWRIVAVCVVLGAVAGYASTLLATEAAPEENFYLATHVLQASNTTTTGGGGGGGGNQRANPDLQRAAFLATSGEVPAQVAAELGLQPGALVRQLSATPRPELGTLEITATGNDPSSAVLMADTTAAQLVSSFEADRMARIDLERAQLDEQKAALETDYAAAIDRCNSLPEAEQELCQIEQKDIEERFAKIQDQIEALDQRTTSGASFTTLQTAEAIPISGPAFRASLDANAAALQGEQPSRNQRGEDDQRSVQEQRIDAALGGSDDEPDPITRTLLGSLAGLVLGMVGVVMFDRLDPRLHTKEQAEAAFGLPVLTEIPPLSRAQQRNHLLLAWDAPRSRTAEAYRQVRSALVFLDETTGAGSPAGANGNGSTNGSGNGSGHGIRSAGGGQQPAAAGPELDTAPPADTADTADTAVEVAGGDDPHAAFRPSLAKASDRPADEEAGERTDSWADEVPDGRADETAKPDRNGTVILVTSPGPGEGKTTTAANLAAVMAETGAQVLVINCDFRRPRLHEYFGGDPMPRKVIETEVPGVRIVHNVLASSRDANPALVINEQRKLATAARRHFDVIILDSAPLLSTNDAVDVLPVADRVVLVAKAGRTTGEAADRAAELLERLEAPVAGVVMIAVKAGPGRRYYYYYEPAGDRPLPAEDDIDHPLEHLLHGSGSDRRG